MTPFVCEICKQPFVADAPSFIAEAECERTFGSLPEGNDVASVCDDCYETFMVWFNSKKEAA